MTGEPEGSTESGSGEAGNRTCDPFFFTPHSTYPLHHNGFPKTFCDFSWVVTSIGPGGIMCTLTEAPEGSTDSGSVEACIEHVTPGLQGIALIHYTMAASIGKSQFCQ